MTGRNPPKSLISVLTPEESLAVFLKAVLAAARSSVLDRPAIASSVKAFSFSEKLKIVHQILNLKNACLVPQLFFKMFQTGVLHFCTCTTMFMYVVKQVQLNNKSTK